MCTRGQKRLEDCKRKRLGEVNRMNCGATAIIIEYNKAKEKEIKRIADEYKDKIPQKLYKALYNWEISIND